MGFTSCIFPTTSSQDLRRAGDHNSAAPLAQKLPTGTWVSDSAHSVFKPSMSVKRSASHWRTWSWPTWLDSCGKKTTKAGFWAVNEKVRLFFIIIIRGLHLKLNKNDLNNGIRFFLHIFLVECDLCVWCRRLLDVRRQQEFKCKWGGCSEQHDNGAEWSYKWMNCEFINYSSACSFILLLLAMINRLTGLFLSCSFSKRFFFPATSTAKPGYLKPALRGYFFLLPHKFLFPTTLGI